MVIEKVMPLFEGDIFHMEFVDEKTQTLLELDYRKEDYGKDYQLLAELLLNYIHVVGLEQGRFYVDVPNAFPELGLICFGRKFLHLTGDDDQWIIDTVIALLMKTIKKNKVVDEEFHENVKLFLDMLEYFN